MEVARKSSRYGHRDATMILIAYRHGGIRWRAVTSASAACSSVARTTATSRAGVAPIFMTWNSAAELYGGANAAPRSWPSHAKD